MNLQKLWSLCVTTDEYLESRDDDEESERAHAAPDLCDGLAGLFLAAVVSV